MSRFSNLFNENSIDFECTEINENNYYFAIKSLKSSFNIAIIICDDESYLIKHYGKNKSDDKRISNGKKKNIELVKYVRELIVYNDLFVFFFYILVNNVFSAF